MEKDKLKNVRPTIGNTMLAVRSLSDLRVGNWVQDTQHFLGYFQIQGVKSEYGGFVETPDQWIPFEEVACIRLTDKWLQEFGADMNGDPTFTINTIDRTLFLVKNKLGQYYPNLFVSAEMSSMDAQCVGLNMIESVHELQNLYYSLTGSELVRQNDR